MNKKANRRAFFVCMLVCLMYASLVVKLPEKMGFERMFDDKKITPAHMNIALQADASRAEPEGASATRPKNPEVKPSQPILEDTYAEPSFFVSIPLVCLAINEGLLEKEGLIPAGKGRQNTVTWKKPIDILYDRDEEGLKNISKTVGVKRMQAFLKRGGITLKHGLSAEEIMLGKGYMLEREKLLALYNSAVPDDYGRLFPFAVGETGVVRHDGNFEFTVMKEEPKKQHAREGTEWQMPNLLNLPMKLALEKLTVHTTKIKIFGSGIVMEQSPRPFERLTGDVECTLHGRKRQ